MDNFPGSGLSSSELPGQTIEDSISLGLSCSDSCQRPTIAILRDEKTVCNQHVNRLTDGFTLPTSTTFQLPMAEPIASSPRSRIGCSPAECLATDHADDPPFGVLKFRHELVNQDIRYRRETGHSESLRHRPTFLALPAALAVCFPKVRPEAVSIDP